MLLLNPYLRSVGQTVVGALRECHDRRQIAQQCGCRGGGRSRLAFPLRFQKQLRLIEKSLAYRGRRRAPGAIQLARLAGRTLPPGKDLCHPPAVLAADPGHRRQALHRDLWRDLARAHPFLHLVWQKFDQRQAARHPTGTAIEAQRQLFHTMAEAPLQLLQQPPFLQLRQPPRPPQGVFQQHRLQFAGRPDHGFHAVPPQLLERPYALIAVNHQIALRRLLCQGHHHDWRLLAMRRQRCQQPLVAITASRPAGLPAPIELVKLQLHACRILLQSAQEACQRLSRLARRGPEVC